MSSPFEYRGINLKERKLIRHLMQHPHWFHSEEAETWERTYPLKDSREQVSLWVNLVVPLPSRAGFVSCNMSFSTAHWVMLWCFMAQKYIVKPLNTFLWKLYSFLTNSSAAIFSLPVSAVSVSRPSLAKKTLFCCAETSAVAEVSSKSTHQSLQFQDYLCLSLVNSVLRPGWANDINNKVTGRTKAATNQALFISAKLSGRARKQNQRAVKCTTPVSPLKPVNLTVLWSGILIHPVMVSLCLLLVSLVFWAAVSGVSCLLSLCQLVLSFTYFFPRMTKGLRWTVNLWMKGFWMNWTTR